MPSLLIQLVSEENDDRFDIRLFDVIGLCLSAVLAVGAIKRIGLQMIAV